MTSEVVAELLPKQLDFINCKTRYGIYTGGWGAGKSVSLSALGIKLAFEHPGIEILACAETAPQVRDTLYAEFMRTCPPGFIKHNRENPTRDVTFKPRFGRESKIMFRAFDDEWKARSFTVGAVLAEELNTLQYETYLQLRGRLRQAGMPGYFRGATNPGPIENWVYPEFIADVPKCDQSELTVVTTTTFDNYTLPEAYLADLRRLEQTNPQYYRRNVLGEWGSMDGLIYELKPHQKKIPDGMQYEEKIMGVDFGFGHPTAFSLIGYSSGRYSIFGEVYKRELTSVDIRRIAKEMHAAHGFKVIYCDSARPEIIEEMRQDGLPAEPAMKGPGSVFAGIMYIKGLLSEDKLFCDYSACPMHAREFGVYVWDKRPNVKEQPVKVNDDAMDSSRYAIYTHALKQGSLQIVYAEPL